MLPRPIQQRVQFDGRLGGTERRPREQRQGQIDGGGVQGVGRIRQIHGKGFVDIHSAGDADQALREVGVNPPVARGIGVGQGVARDLAANPHVIQPLALRAQTRLDVAQAFPKSQLRKRHAQKLIHAGESLDPAVPAVTGHAALEHHRRQMTHHLRKYQLARMHRRSPGNLVQGTT